MDYLDRVEPDMSCVRCGRHNVVSTCLACHVDDTITLSRLCDMLNVETNEALIEAVEKLIVSSA